MRIKINAPFHLDRTTQSASAWRRWVAVLGLVVAAGSSPRDVGCFDLAKTSHDLAVLFAPKERGKPPVRPLFSQTVVADLNGDGRKEMVIPGSDGRLRLLRLLEHRGRLELGTWAIVNTRFAGDSAVGSCYLTAASLEKGATETLVLSLPRGIFAVRIVGEPPSAQFYPFCDRAFFDPGQEESQPRRLDFLSDLDGDGAPEVWMPQHNGMAFWRRDPKTKGWEPIHVPPLPVRVRQFAGAQPLASSAFQPSQYRLGFRYSLSYPAWQTADLNRDGQSDLMVLWRDDVATTPKLRMECFELRDSLHFSTTPMQVRVVEDSQANQVFLDLNGDGFLDLLEVDSNLDVVKPRTSVNLHISPPVREYTFSRHTHRYVTSDPLGMVLYGDWNRDGLADIAHTQFEYKFGSTDDLVDLILGREVTVIMRFIYGKAGGFGDTDQSLRLEIRNRCFNYRLFPPLSMDGDFNGDRHADLVVRTKPDQCKLYLSQAGNNELDNRAARTVSIADEAYCFIEDMDGDGRSDLIACDPKAPAIALFLSRP